MIEFTVCTTPRPWQRPRFNSNTGSVFTAPAIKAYSELIRIAAVKAMGGRAPFAQPIIVNLSLASDTFCDWKRFGDVDNLSKIVLDAMNGIVYLDDSLIIELTAEKIFDRHSYVKISVKPFGD